MKRNVGTTERVLRAVGGVAMIGGGLLVPFPWLLALFALGGYMLFSAAAGTCYLAMGASSCSR